MPLDDEAWFVTRRAARRAISMTVFALLVSLIGVCSAEAMSIGLYQKLMARNDESAELIKNTYWTGVAFAFATYALWIEQAQGPKLYCPPKGVGLTGKVIQSLSESYLQQERDKGAEDQADARLTDVALLAVRRAFPCGR